MENIVEKAEKLARKAHKGQCRKFGGFGEIAYIIHPEAVAAKFQFGPPELQAAAWLHDVAEDTDVSLDDIYREFGTPIGDIVDTLTRRKGESYLDYILRIKRVDLGAVAVKLADLTHNLSDLEPRSLRDKYEMALYILTH